MNSLYASSYVLELPKKSAAAPVKARGQLFPPCAIECPIKLNPPYPNIEITPKNIKSFKDKFLDKSSVI